MRLPRGITGFGLLDAPPPPACDAPAFRGCCHAAARALNGSVVEVQAPGIATNFACAVLELPTGRVAVLLNDRFPVVAFAQPPDECDAILRFIDAPQLAEAFRTFGVYDVLDTSELAEPLTPEHCRCLTEDEREQIKYWKPRRVGEVVFNFWD